MNYGKDNTPEKTQVGTIYDDVYRTLTVGCSRLLLPVLNEVFGGKIIETETLKNYRAVALETKREVAFRMRDLGMEKTDIAYALRVSVSTVEEWLDPVPA